MNACVKVVGQECLESMQNLTKEGAIRSECTDVTWAKMEGKEKLIK